METDDPVKTAEAFSKRMKAEGFLFDYSLKSLETEIDRFLEKQVTKSEEEKEQIEIELTAYIGESIRRIYNGKWTGEFNAEAGGVNFYLCKVSIGKFEFYPSHFISYYLNNGKKSEGSFYEYLYTRNQSKGIAHDFLGGGLIHLIAKGK